MGLQSRLTLKFPVRVYQGKVSLFISFQFLILPSHESEVKVEHTMSNNPNEGQQKGQFNSLSIRFACEKT